MAGEFPGFNLNRGDHRKLMKRAATRAANALPAGTLTQFEKQSHASLAPLGLCLSPVTEHFPPPNRAKRRQLKKVRKRK